MLQRQSSCLAWKVGWQTSRQAESSSPHEMYRTQWDFARDSRHKAIAGTKRCPYPHPKQAHQTLSQANLTWAVKDLRCRAQTSPGALKLVC